MTKPIRSPAQPPYQGLHLGVRETPVSTRPAGFLGERQPGANMNVVLPPDAHGLVIGQTGCGKGVSSIIPILLRYPGPILVIDPKGEAAEVTARHRAALGHEVVVLDPMGTTSCPSGAFNPLDTIDIRSAMAVDDTAAMVQSLMAGASADVRDRWWSQQAQHQLIGLVMHVLADLPEYDRHLGSVRRLTEEGLSDPKGLSAAMHSSRHGEVRQIAHMLNIAADTTLGGIMAFAQSSVSFLRGELVGNAVARTSFDVDKITDGAPMTLYLVLPPHMLESHGRLLRAWLSGLLSLIMRRRRRPPLNTLLLIDEAAALGELPQLRLAVTFLRGYGLQTISYWQDVAQLKQLYPADWQTIVNNCGVVQCFESGNLRAAETVCELLGWNDPPSAMALGGWGKIIHQERGRMPVIAQLADYRHDPDLKGRWDPNPFFADTGLLIRTAPRTRALGYMRAGESLESLPAQRLWSLQTPTAGDT